MPIMRVGTNLIRTNGGLGRRLGTIIGGGQLAATSASVILSGDSPLIVGNNPSDLAITDLTYLGQARADLTGMAYSTGQVAVRYVSGQRRLLLSKWSNTRPNRNWQTDLIEVTLPTLQPTQQLATNVTLVRQWADWHHQFTGADFDALENGWHVGSSMYWDDEQDVLWYTMWPEYLGNASYNLPFLAATRLNEDGTTTKYGPWRYKSNTGATGWKKLAQQIIRIPPSMQSAFGGRKVALFAQGIGAGGGSEANWGPGGYAIHLPALNSTDPVEEGIAIADYSPQSGLPHPNFHCYRDTNYNSYDGSGAQPAVSNGKGYWQASSDKAYPAAWVDGSKKGLLLIGKLVHGDTWYGFENRRGDGDADPYNPGIPMGPDPLLVNEGSSGYFADAHDATVWIFKHDHLLERAAGTRAKHSDGMEPQVIHGAWNTVWTAIQNPSNSAWVRSHEGFVVDPVTNQMIWVHPRERQNGPYEPNPIIHVFQLPSDSSVQANSASITVSSETASIIDRTLLTQSDFTYLGKYNINLGGEFSYGYGLTHMYDGATLKFLAVEYNGGNHRLRVITPPALGGTVSSAPSILMSNLSPTNFVGRQYGIHYDQTTQRLFINSSIDYPDDEEASYIDSFSYVELNPSTLAYGSPSGRFGLSGVQQRRGYGGVRRVPSWFQTAYGVEEFCVGFGGYASRMTLGTTLGPTLYAVDDPANVIGSGGGTYAVEQFTKLMDANGASGNDWYTGTGQTVPTTYDRGHRIAGRHVNFYDSGGYPSTPPTKWGTAPDGRGRFTWGDSYASNMVWIDSPTKHGLFAAPIVHLGNTWYEDSTLNYDASGVEFHIFDPVHLGEVVQGTRSGANVGPASMWIPADIPNSGPGAGNLGGAYVTGVTFDSTTNRLYLRRTFASGSWPNTIDHIHVYQVNL